MRERTAKLLHDAFSACEELEFFSSGKTEAEYLHDRGLKIIVQKLIENVGEALHQAERSESKVAAQIPDLRLIVDTRNRTIHGYDSVDYKVLWDVVQNNIPVLKRELASLLEKPEIDDET